MKTKLLLFFIILSFGFSNAQIVNIPNANFKARLLLASTSQQIAYNSSGATMKIDTNNDGNIQVSEALLVHQLYVMQQSIADLTGIESFTNLRNLQCSTNQLTVLNINSLTNLTTLGCSFNQLTSLNVSNLNNLISISCSNNQLTVLDFSNLNALTSITCSNNQLSVLNVNNMNNLVTLNCENNNLTSLDVSNKIFLKSFN